MSIDRQNTCSLVTSHDLNFLEVGIELLESHGTVGLVLGIINSFGLHHLGVDGLHAQDEVELKQSPNDRNDSHSPEVKT